MSRVCLALALAGLLLATPPAAAAEPAARAPAVKPQAKPAPPAGGPHPAAEPPTAPAAEPPIVPAAEPPVTAATPAGDWYGGPVPGADGKFAYCVTENRYDTGHLLIIALSPQGEINVGMQIPGASLPKDTQWTVTLSVDGGTERTRTAVATQGDLLVMPQGKDDELFERLMNGAELLIRSDTDRVAFRLKGTKKALSDLRTCIAKGGDVPVSRPAPPRSGPLPDELMTLLAEAGIRDVAPVPLDNLPADRRPDFLWRAGSVTASVRQHAVDETATLSEISDLYRTAMVKACAGAAATYGDVEVMVGLTLRTGSLECPSAKGPLHVALLLYLTDAKLFTLFTHEAPASEAATADGMRDRLAAAVRALAAKEFSIDRAFSAPAKAKAP
ncbi:hypothetical protein [Azospirillum sp. A39]|uniref:hypothetical protein n=1 Tax=Azospirillum sp. A39 TaxID=3462279 RepID=UPI00404536D3